MRNIKKVAKSPTYRQDIGYGDIEYFEQPFLVMHTVKAARKGHPDDRVFVVICQQRVGRAMYYGAYKCRLTKSGLEHPAYKAPIKTTDPKFWSKVGVVKPRNGAHATASFKIDSFYTEITFEQLQELLAKDRKAKLPESNTAFRKRVIARFDELVAAGWTPEDFHIVRCFKGMVPHEKLEAGGYYAHRIK